MVSTLSDERMGEIALKVLKHRMEREGVKLTPNFLREVGSTAKEINVSRDELVIFVETLTRELLEGIFSKK